MHEIFIRFSVDKLNQFTERIDTCLAKLSPEQIWWREAEAQNAIGNLVLHLCGNLGQWVLSAVGGAPDNRQRDLEFSASGGVSTEELRRRLKERVTETVALIEALPAGRMIERVNVQKYNLTVLEVVYHVVEHFAGHTGQIIFATKLLKGEDLGYYEHLARAAHEEKVP